MCFLLAMATQKIYITEINRLFHFVDNGNHFGPLTESGGLDRESLDEHVAHLSFLMLNLFAWRASQIN